MLYRKNNTETVGSIAVGAKFSFVVDDGYHTMKSIGLTFESFRPFLHESFLYVVEDIALEDLESSKELFKDYRIDVCDADERILAITPRLALIDPQARTELKLDLSIL